MQITLANLKDATAQQVFDHVKSHMLTQREQSMRGGTCAYRGDNGKMCAAGCLMTDSEYKAIIVNERGIDDSTGFNWDFLADQGYVTSKHKVLISTLQSIHDGSKPKNWEAELEKVVISHGLV